MRFSGQGLTHRYERIESSSTGSGKRSDGAVKHSVELIRLKWAPTCPHATHCKRPIGFPAAG